MKSVVFKHLSIQNWRAQNKSIAFGKEETIISGRNASGKSTTWDAILWLFTGYDSLDRMNYQLFDNRVIPTKETSTPASVELTFSIDDTEYRLKRTAEMGWVRKRGASEYEKKPSDDYKFEIDGVEVSSSSYKEFIESNFCPIDKLKFILNIDYYKSLDWKELRKHFADIIGEVKREDYVGDLSAAFALIDRYGSIDAARDYLKSQRTPLRNSIGDGSSRGTKDVELETLISTLPDISGVPAAESKLAEIKKSLDEIDKAMTGQSEHIRPILEKRTEIQKEIYVMKNELADKKDAYEADYRKRLNELRRAVDEINSDNERIRKKKKKKKTKIEEASMTLESEKRKLLALNAKRENLLERNEEVKARQFTDENCPYCGQPLPEDKMEEAKIRFEKEKENMHNIIVAEGRANNLEIEKCKSAINECEEIIARGYVPAPFKDTDTEKSKLADFEALYIPFEETDEYRDKDAEIRLKIASMPEVPDVGSAELTARKQSLYDEMSECAKLVSVKFAYNKQKERIETLKQDIRDTAEQLAKIEGTLAEIDEVERQKAEIIRKRTSALFHYCEVTMEERRKDGSMAPACNILIDGVMAQVANTASKIKAGADISNAFSLYFGLNMPLIIDNRERVDASYDFRHEGRQLIEMRHTDSDFIVA